MLARLRRWLRPIALHTRCVSWNRTPIRVPPLAFRPLPLARGRRDTPTGLPRGKRASLRLCTSTDAGEFQCICYAKLLCNRPFLSDYQGNGEGGIRTLGTLLGYGALAKRCFRPLSHLTKSPSRTGTSARIWRRIDDCQLLIADC